MCDIIWIGKYCSRAGFTVSVDQLRICLFHSVWSTSYVIAVLSNRSEKMKDFGLSHLVAHIGLKQLGLLFGGFRYICVQNTAL